MLKQFELSTPSHEAIRARLRVLATTDLHMHILPYDYLSDCPVDGWGLTNTSKLIDQARKEHPNTILLDNGDFLHGTAMGDLVVEQYRAASGSADPVVHPMIAAMDHIGYDAATLGNHDFDRGLEVLLDAVEQASFPVISANTVVNRGTDPTRDSTLVAPYAMLHRTITDECGCLHDIHIAVIGFLPPGSLRIGHNSGAAPDTRDIIETARAFVPYVKARGADIVIALAHSGIGEDAHIHGMENALRPLSRIAGIDAIIGGHSHQVFPCEEQDLPDETQDTGCLNEVPCVVPGFWGSHLGVIDLDLEFGASGWAVVSGKGALQKVASVNETKNGGTHDTTSAKPALPNWFQKLHENTLQYMRSPIAKSRCDLDNFLGIVGADRATRLVQEAMIDHARRIQAEHLITDLPVLASSAPFKSGGLAGPNYYTKVQAGEITVRSISDLYLFPNELALVQTSGAYIKDWLERSASLFNQVQPHERFVNLKDDSTPGYLLESVLGLTYEIDLSQAARFTPAGAIAGLGGGRIVNLRHQGQLVKDTDQFLLATSDFRVRGGGGFPVAPANSMIAIPPLAIRDIVKAYICRLKVIDVPNSPIWSFSKQDGASVCFRSSPQAESIAKAYPWLTIKRMVKADHQGFAYYEMEL